MIGEGMRFARYPREERERNKRNRSLLMSGEKFH